VQTIIYLITGKRLAACSVNQSKPTH